jgi:hypothetical protein
MTTTIRSYSLRAYERREFKDFSEALMTTSADIINDAIPTWDVVKTGVDNLLWRQMIRNAQNATTNYTVVGRRFHVLKAFGRVAYSDKFGRLYIRGFLGHPQPLSWPFLSDPSSMVTSSADLLARQRFVSNYRSRRTAFQSGVFLGELMEVVRMIRSPAKALREGLDHYHKVLKKRLRRSNPRNRKRIIQDTWLEYTFGWSPLVNDVRAAAELATAHPMAVFETIKGGAEIENLSTHLQGSHTVPTGCRVNYTIVTTGAVVVSYKGAIRAENAPPTFPEQLGLSWSNLAPTVWELIPYSFLIDYFTNVGKVIDGVSTGVISLAWGCRNEVKSYSAEVISRGFDHNYADTVPTKPFGAISHVGHGEIAGPLCSRSTYNRTKVEQVSVGIGDLTFKLPGSNLRWLNIAALAKLKQ